MAIAAAPDETKRKRVTGKKERKFKVRENNIDWDNKQAKNRVRGVGESKEEENKGCISAYSLAAAVTLVNAARQSL